MDCAKTTTYITCYLVLDALLLHWINGQFVGGDMFHLSRTQYKLKDEQHMFYIISWWLTISNYSLIHQLNQMIDWLTHLFLVLPRGIFFTLGDISYKITFYIILLQQHRILQCKKLNFPRFRDYLCVAFIRPSSIICFLFENIIYSAR